MTDIFDRGQERAEMLLRQALEAQRLKAAVQVGRMADAAQWRVLSASECEGSHCGEPIPDDRRRLLPGVRLCVDCQARLERGYGK